MTVTSKRLRVLVDRPPRESARYVLYWMQQSQRAYGNLALDHAIELANELHLPVVACFGLTDGYPEANARHYAFMLEGLADAARGLKARGVCFVIRRGAPDDVAVQLSGEAAVVVCDRGYLKPQRRWREGLANRAECRVVEVEGDVVVPLELASTKHEFAARTLRPKIHRLWDEFLVETPDARLNRTGDVPELRSDIDLSDPVAALASMTVDRSIAPVRRFVGGLTAARERLAVFLGDALDGYAEMRARPERAAVSHLSPYLHFGQISPLEVALAAKAAPRGGLDDRSSFIEELIVRRELAKNHVFYEPHYDRYESAPAWARTALDERRGDERPYLYDWDTFFEARTHDRFWNAAQREMRDTGYMHNRMRMYWGKKIIEWTGSPEEAFDTTMRLNNSLFLCGRDENSFTNVSWLFGLHDRPWFRRPIFGTVRYLGQNTLKKFDSEAYVAAVDTLVATETV